MLDPKLLRENPDAVKGATRVKRVASPEMVDAWLAADERRRHAQTLADQLKAGQNKLGQQIGQRKRQLKGGTNPELDAILARSNELKSQQTKASDDQAAGEAEAQQIMLQLPAVPDPTWPVGADERGNKVVRTWADPSIPPAPLAEGRRDHIALGQQLGIVDFERGVKLAGSRSYVLRGAGAMLYQAVLRFALDHVTRRG